MIYPIVVVGHPVLRKKAEQINQTYPELDKLIADMFETMYASDGVGLAAPQIGKSIRLFVVDASPLTEEYPGAETFKQVFINPIILEETGNPWLFSEGCLSLPGIREDVQRKPVVKISYLDEKWQQHTETFDGIRARIIQHEYDHLEGTLFTDKLSLLRKRMLKGRITDISKGKVDVGYRILLK